MNINTRIVNRLSAMLLAVQSVLAVVVLTGRDIIPIHWNLSGEVDRYGASGNVIVMLVISAFVFAVMLYLERHPEHCNFPCRVKDEEQAYRLMSSLVSLINLCVMVIMTFILLSTYIGPSMPIWPVFIPAVLLVILSVYSAIRLSRV